MGRFYKKTKKILALLISFISLAIILLGLSIYSGDFAEKVSISNTSNVKIKESVILNFSVPILKSSYVEGIKIYPDCDFKAELDGTKRKVTITPEEIWHPESEYVISLPEGYSAMFTKIKMQQFRFSAEKYPNIKRIIPANGEKDVVLGAEDPIIVNFDKSTKGFFVDFQMDPANEFIFQNDSEKTQFRLLPKNKLEDGRSYGLKIKIKLADDSDSDYREIYSGTFETLAPAPTQWNKDFSLRLEEAKKYTRAKISTGKYIDINLASQVMSIFEDGKNLGSFLISSGKRGMDTPKGKHQIYNKFPRAFSKKYGLYMPYWMAIASDGKFGIHELPEWPGGYKEGTNHLGIPVSHGCVRLGVGSAQRVYNWAEIGTPVIVY